MDINPGPANLIVLWDQENHVSSDLWQNIVSLLMYNNFHFVKHLLETFML